MSPGQKKGILRPADGAQDNSPTRNSGGIIYPQMWLTGSWSWDIMDLEIK